MSQAAGVGKITPSAVSMCFAPQRSSGRWRENKLNAGRNMAGGPGDASARAVKGPCRRRSLKKLAPGGPREVEMLLLLDTLCHTEVMEDLPAELQ